MVKLKSTSGLRDWIIQRVSALILLTFLIVITVVLLRGGDYAAWSSFFGQVWVKWLTVLATLSLCWHAWIGLWTIFTDYVKNTAVRVGLEIIVLALNLFYVIWTIKILWW